MVCVWRGEVPEDSKGLDTHSADGLHCDRGQQAGTPWVASSSWQAWPSCGPPAWGPGDPSGEGREESVRYDWLTSRTIGPALTCLPT